MRRNHVVWTGLVLSAVCFAGAAAGGDKIPPQPVSGKLTWVYDYAEGKEAARQSGKPLFVVFRCER